MQRVATAQSMHRYKTLTLTQPHQGDRRVCKVQLCVVMAGCTPCVPHCAIQHVALMATYRVRVGVTLLLKVTPNPDPIYDPTPTSR